jgi:hypothetical protein
VISTTSWSVAMGYVLMASIAGGFVAGLIAKWWDQREIRAIRRRRRKLRATWKELNDLKPGCFQIKNYTDWSSR